MSKEGAMEEQAEAQETGRGNKNAFRTIILLYAATILALLGYALYRPGYVWLVTGLLISSIYPLVAVYYFYSGYFIPYHQEKRRVHVEGRGMCLLLSQWIVPVIVIQVFVCLGFWLTIDHAPTRKTLYTNPYQYGLIYKQLNAEKVKPNNLPAFNAVLTEAAPFFESQKEPRGKPPAAPDREEAELLIFTIPFYIAVTFGFLGSLIYTLRDIGYRYYTEDLQPRTFINYIIRFFFAAVICLVIAYFLMDGWWTNTAPLLFFFIGYFPDRGMQYIEESGMKLLNLKKENRLDLPLGLIQGTNDYLIYRLKEIGIHDIQNLAYVDLKELRTNIGYGTGLLCDFVAQALLFIHLKDHFTVLQAFGIRNIILFRRIINRENYQSMAEAMSIPPQKLLNTLEVMDTAPMKTRIDDLETCRMDANRAEP